jgi:hypothetical protein
MNFKRLLHQPLGKVFISILLGLGVATLFRKVCNDRNCIVYKGSATEEIDGKIFKHGSKCYKYNHQHVESCDSGSGKKVVDISRKSEEEKTKSEEHASNPLLGMANPGKG